MRWLLNAYHEILHRFPYTVSCIQTGLLTATGDVIAQNFVEKTEDNSKKKFNYIRNFQYFCVGAFYAGPALTAWYRVLDRQLAKGGKYRGLKKMAVDQICFAPLLLGGFLVIVDAVRGAGLEDIKKSLKRNYADIMITNYKLWPAAQAINFTFVPLNYQILYVQVIAVFWNTYLCYKTRPQQ